MPSLGHWLNLAVNGLLEGSIIALAALGVTLVFGIARFPNAAAGDTMTLGAYVGFGLQGLLGGSIVAATLGAMTVTALLGVLTYLWLFRSLARGPMVASLIASIGLAFFLRGVLTFIVGHDQQVFDVPIVRGMVIGPIRVVPTDLYLAGAALGALLLVFGLLQLTPLGRQLRAVADDPQLARVSGIPARRVMISLWAVAGAVTGLAGVLLGVKTVIGPEMGWDLLLPTFAAVILGGIGSPLGAVLGGLLLGLAQELSTPLVGFTYKIGMGFVMLSLVLLVRPTGLLGRSELVR